ncbi:MFS transporter [Staphylococcus casei]|uniref:MFS transporter n=1 Tax=Staphylococcus TaxID=1279 RepID=UPI000CD159E7|nr:MFS transporter [Staphylococcus casei]PNZ58534.1 MFS transporter [Staphylococcus casei]WJE87548.1 MFS transporter [Staphylococcus casei]
MLGTSIKTRYLLSYLGCLAFFASLTQNIYTPMIPEIQNTFDVPLIWVNTTVGGFIFIVAVMQIILGKYVDFQDPKRLLVIGIGITLLTSLMCSITHNFIVFAVFRLIQAIGCGIIPLVAITLLANISSEHNRPSVMANYQIILSCAPAISPILGGLIGGYYQYKGIFVLLTLISIISFISLIFSKFPTHKNKTQVIYKINYSTLFSSSIFNIMIISGFLVFFTYFSILVYMPILFTIIYNLSTTVTGFLFLPLTISIILGSILYKKLSFYLSNRLIHIYTHITLVVLLLLFALLNTYNIYLVAIILFMIGIMIGIEPALVSTTLTQTFPSAKGGALGIFNFIRYIGMTLGSITIGLFNIHTTYYFFIGIALAFIFLLFITVIYKRHTF